MPRRRSLTTLFFSTARTMDDVETLASGNFKRIKNRILGRMRGGRGLVAALAEETWAQLSGLGPK